MCMSWAAGGISWDSIPFAHTRSWHSPQWMLLIQNSIRTVWPNCQSIWKTCVHSPGLLLDDIGQGTSGSYIWLMKLNDTDLTQKVLWELFIIKTWWFCDILLKPCTRFFQHDFRSAFRVCRHVPLAQSSSYMPSHSTSSPVNYSLLHYLCIRFIKALDKVSILQGYKKA